MTQRDRDDRKPSSAPGASIPGQPFRPSDLPSEEEETPDRPVREAPSPGVPTPADEYKRLKEDEARRQTPRDVPAQEDEPSD